MTPNSNSALARNVKRLAHLDLPGAGARLREAPGREPSHAELADKLSLKAADIPKLLEAEAKPYQDGGFKVYDVSKPANPRLIAYQKTGGIGVHRYDMDANYAYIS